MIVNVLLVIDGIVIIPSTAAAGHLANFDGIDIVC